MNNPHNFMSGKAHGPSLAIIIGKPKNSEHEEHEADHGDHDYGNSSGYTESGPASCGKCSYFEDERCHEEHVLKDPAVKKDDRGAIVDGEYGWSHYFDPRGPHGKDSEMMAKEEEDPEKEHNYPERFTY